MLIQTGLRGNEHTLFGKPGPHEISVRVYPPKNEAATTSLVLVRRKHSWSENQEGLQTLDAFPCALPSTSKWLVRLISLETPFVFELYRRHMKTIGYLWQMDKLIAARATTRNWNTIAADIQGLKDPDKNV